MMLPLLLCFAVLLTACAGNNPPLTPTIQVQLRSVEVPVSLRHCLTSPAKPKGEYTQRDVALYIVKLNASRNDCAYRLSAVDKLLINNRVAIDAFNAQQAALASSASLSQ